MIETVISLSIPRAASMNVRFIWRIRNEQNILKSENDHLNLKHSQQWRSKTKLQLHALSLSYYNFWTIHKSVQNKKTNKVLIFKPDTPLARQNQNVYPQLRLPCHHLAKICHRRLSGRVPRDQSTTWDLVMKTIRTVFKPSGTLGKTYIRGPVFLIPLGIDFRHISKNISFSALLELYFRQIEQYGGP